MVLGKLPVPGRPTNLDLCRARAYCACIRCGWGLFGYFFSRLSSLFFFSLSLGDGPIYTEILSQRAVKPKTTNQTTYNSFTYDTLPFYGLQIQSTLDISKLKLNPTTDVSK